MSQPDPKKTPPPPSPLPTTSGKDKAPDVSPANTTSPAYRVAAIERRWGKRFEEVLVDIHDHLFGKTEALPPKTPETEPPKTP